LSLCLELFVIRLKIIIDSTKKIGDGFKHAQDAIFWRLTWEPSSGY
jgi:hypothetical protein